MAVVVGGNVYCIIRNSRGCIVARQAQSSNDRSADAGTPDGGPVTAVHRHFNPLIVGVGSCDG